jgi:hypothetical protein
VREQIDAEAEFMAEGIALLRDLAGEPAVGLVRRALDGGVRQARERLFFLLGFLYDRDTVLRARDNLALPSAEKQAYALEVLDVLLPQDVKRVVVPLLAGSPANQEADQSRGRQEHRQCLAHLVDIVGIPPGRYSPWTRAAALHAAGLLVSYPAGQPDEARLCLAAQALLPSSSFLIDETAAWVLQQLHQNGPLPAQNRKVPMLTIERVLALRQASLFGETSDETLAEIAPLLEEVSLPAGHTIVSKGDLGDCMYLIVSGEVRVHDGEHTLNHLEAGEVFGEMAVLDAEPRMASVTTAMETVLLRLDQESLYEAMADHSEVGQGIIRVLLHHLRARAQEVSQLRGRLKTLEA